MLRLFRQLRGLSAVIGCGDICQHTGIGRQAVASPPRSVRPPESPNHRSVVDVRAIGADGSMVTVSGTLYGPQLSQKIVQISGPPL